MSLSWSSLVINLNIFGKLEEMHGGRVIKMPTTHTSLASFISLQAMEKTIEEKQQ